MLEPSTVKVLAEETLNNGSKLQAIHEGERAFFRRYTPNGGLKSSIPYDHDEQALLHFNAAIMFHKLKIIAEQP